MDKELLFKEIRRQQVLLWAGAGFSLYAGYPLGKGVVKQLYAELSTEQRKRLASSIGQDVPCCPETMPLPEFAQRFVTLNNNNRDRLVEVLDKIFSAEPESIHVHERLATLAYIDYIVTTNYDSLFERAYGSANLHVVTDAENVPQIEKKPTTLFKIHGQLSRPKTLVITRDDYQNFFEKADKLVWTNLQALMSRRTLLFIGYAVEDPNVLDAFLSIREKLGDFMRPAYVVGPNMDSIRQDELRLKNIHFIQATGEQFIDELLEDTKKKALYELTENSEAYIKPISRTLKNLGLKFDMQIDGSELKIHNIKRRDGPTQRKISLSIDSLGMSRELDEFKSSDYLKAIKFSGDQLTHFTRTVEGFVLPNNNIESVWMMRAPGWEGTADIRFNSGILITNVLIKVYSVKSGLNIVALTDTSRVEFGIFAKPAKKDSIKAFLEYRNDTLPSVSALLEHAYIMRALDKSDHFEVLQKGKSIWSTREHVKLSGLKPTSKNPEEGDYLVSMVEMLPTIERAFGFSFQHISLKNQIMEEIVELYNILTKSTYTEKKDKSIDFSLELENPIIESIQPGKSKALKTDFSIEATYTHAFNILGWTLQISWREKETVTNPTCKRIHEGNDYRFRSRNNTFVHQYLTVDSTKIIEAPKWHEPQAQSIEDIIQEQLPRANFK